MEYKILSSFKQGSHINNKSANTSTIISRLFPRPTNRTRTTCLRAKEALEAWSNLNRTVWRRASIARMLGVGMTTFALPTSLVLFDFKLKDPDYFKDKEPEIR